MWFLSSRMIFCSRKPNCILVWNSTGDSALHTSLQDRIFEWSSLIIRGDLNLLNTYLARNSLNVWNILEKAVSPGIKKCMSFICWPLLKLIINQHYCNTAWYLHWINICLKILTLWTYMSHTSHVMLVIHVGLGSCRTSHWRVWLHLLPAVNENSFISVKCSEIFQSRCHKSLDNRNLLLP